MKRLALMIIIFTVFLTIMPVNKIWADGGYFPRRGELSEPTQKAAIFFDGKREDLIIEVSFNGATIELIMSSSIISIKNGVL